MTAPAFRPCAQRPHISSSGPYLALPMRRAACLLALLAPLALAACDSAETTGRFTADVDPPAVVLTNGTSRTVYHLVFDAETAMVIDLSDNLDDWNRLEAGRRTAVPFERVMPEGGVPGEAVVYWRTREGEGGAIWLDLD